MSLPTLAPAGAATANSCCPVCGSPDLALHLDGDERDLSASNIGSSRKVISFGRIVRCRSCRFGFRSFRPSDDELASLYREADDHAYEREAPGRKQTAIRHARMVQRYFKVPGRLLDVGCASGAYLLTMADAGWTVEGVEPSREHFAVATRTLGDRGRVQGCTLQDANFSDKFDAVTLWDVLEHVTNPLAFLETCRRHLRDAGQLFLNVPDLDSPQARLLGKRWPLLLAEHLNYFNRESLRVCAERAGFQWVATGRRPVTFSVGYVLYRLSQHGFALRWIAKGLDCSALGRLSVPLWMGERYAVLKRMS